MTSITILQENDFNHYNAFIEKASDANVCHTLEWKTVIEQSLKCKAFYLIARAGDEIVEALPMFLIQKPFLGKKIISLPLSLGYYSAFLSKNEIAKKNLTEQAIKIAKQLQVKYIEIRTNCEEKELRELGFVEKRPLFFPVVELITKKENRQRLSKGHRASLSFINKNKVRVRETTDIEDLKLFYAMLSDSYRAFGTPIFDYAFLRNMWVFLRNIGFFTLLMVELDDELMGGGLFLHYNKTLIYKYGACKNEYLQYRPYQALVWHAIELGIERGYTTLDLGATELDNDGLLSFKKHFGATLYQSYYYYLPLKGDFPNIQDYYSSYTLVKSIWKKLPKWFVGSIGPKIIEWVC